MLEHVANAFVAVLAWQSVLAMCVGTIIGIVLSALPGLSATMCVALAIPFTYGMDHAAGARAARRHPQRRLAGRRDPGGAAADSGNAGSICTAWDGYPMAQQGHARGGDQPRRMVVGGRRHDQRAVARAAWRRRLRMWRSPSARRRSSGSTSLGSSTISVHARRRHAEGHPRLLLRAAHRHGRARQRDRPRALYVRHPRARQRHPRACRHGGHVLAAARLGDGAAAARARRQDRLRHPYRQQVLAVCRGVEGVDQVVADRHRHRHPAGLGDQRLHRL